MYVCVCVVVRGGGGCLPSFCSIAVREVCIIVLLNKARRPYVLVVCLCGGGSAGACVCVSVQLLCVVSAK